MSGGTVEFDGAAAALTSVTLESYHGDTDWNLHAEGAAGPVLQLSGTADGELTPGSLLLIHHIDQPAEIVVGGQAGMLVTTPDDRACSITVVAVDASSARLEAELVLEWVSSGWEGTPSRPYRMRIAVDAERQRR